MTGAPLGEPSPSAEPSAAVAEPELHDPGAVRNTLLQLVSQIATTVFTAGLTLYLVRALGASRYGVYALASSIGGLASFPASMGLPTAVGRFLAEHRRDLSYVRGIIRLGLKLQIPGAFAVGLALFALAGPLADAYGDPRLGWPLRWMAIAVFAQAVFTYVGTMTTSVRRISVSLWMVIIESATETSGAILLVVFGAGAAGAMLGKAIGYVVAVAAGFYLTARLLGSLRARRASLPKEVGVRAIASYAGVMLVVDVTWTAIMQVDILLIGALLTTVAVGSFGAVLRILTVLGYLGIAVANGVAPRLSLGDGSDTRTLIEGIRYLIIVQGLVIAPMVIWSHPITQLLLGSGYKGASVVLRVLAVQAFVSGPSALVSLAVTYLGEARRRVPIMVATLVLGLISTYVLLRTVGLVGAAIADDLVQVVYLLAHVWLCNRVVKLELRRLAWSSVRTVYAAVAMGLVLFAFGTGHLSAWRWFVGGVAAVAVYAIVLIVSRELTVDELRAATSTLKRGFRPATS